MRMYLMKMMMMMMKMEVMIVSVLRLTTAMMMMMMTMVNDEDDEWWRLRLNTLMILKKWFMKPSVLFLLPCCWLVECDDITMKSNWRGSVHIYSFSYVTVWNISTVVKLSLCLGGWICSHSDTRPRRLGDTYRYGERGGSVSFCN